MLRRTICIHAQIISNKVKEQAWRLGGLFGDPLTHYEPSLLALGLHLKEVQIVLGDSEGGDAAANGDLCIVGSRKNIAIDATNLYEPRIVGGTRAGVLNSISSGVAVSLRYTRWLRCFANSFHEMASALVIVSKIRFENSLRSTGLGGI